MPEHTENPAAGPSGTPAQPNPGPRLLALVVGGLSLALLGFTLGRVGSTPASPLGPSADHTHPPGVAPHEHPTGVAAGAATDVGGLSISVGGYTLVPAATAFPAGVSQEFRFHVQGPDHQPVTGFAVVHDRPMHLIVANRDLTGYQHLHPTMAPDGTWSVPITLPAPGVWRAYADFTLISATRQQTSLALGVDLFAAGAHTQRPLPPAVRDATIGGFTVTYQGTPQVGTTQPLLFHVSRDGQPVTGLQPYLGAYGHLVVLRDGDLAYLHVHSETGLSDGAVRFWLAAPSPGRYRMFFDFQIADTVQTAEFTLVIP